MARFSRLKKMIRFYCNSPGIAAWKTGEPFAALSGMLANADERRCWAIGNDQLAAGSNGNDRGLEFGLSAVASQFPTIP